MFVPFESRSTTPLAGGAAVAEPPAESGPRIRWSVPGASGELRLESGATAPVLVPVHEHGASLAAALVEALDRSVTRAEPVLEARRGQADVTFVRGEWPRPSRPPSEILAGQVSDAPAGGARRLAELRALVGAEGLERLRAFPARRRSLALHRRRLERNFFRHDEDLRSAKRNTLCFAGLGAAGFAATLAGVLADASGLSATGALLCALCASGVFVGVTGRTRNEALREIVRRAMARVVRHEEAVEDDANALARTLGSDDPWALAEELARLEAEPPAVHDRVELAERRRIGFDLAQRLDVPVAALEDAAIWSAPRACTSSSWPPDVARHEEAGGAAVAVVGMARLLHRVQRDLPQPWPIVLWEPWAGAAADVRARRLVALTALAGGRPVIALVRG